MPPKFTAAITPSDHVSGPAFWFAFAGDRMLAFEEGPHFVPHLDDFADLGLAVIRRQYLGQLGEHPCFSVELEVEATPPSGMRFQDLRYLLLQLDETLGKLAGRAIQVMAWDRDHQFCSRCGATPETLPHERTKKCPNCGLSSYPRLSPAIIVRVRRGDEILLARAHRWPPGMYSVLAGFVEPGETLEEAVAREVYEEVGLQVENIRYFGSQPWPFPNSLMLGFTADYAGGELRLEEAEIEDARWYPLDQLPKIPPKISIARRLIDDFQLRH